MNFQDYHHVPDTKCYNCQDYIMKISSFWDLLHIFIFFKHARGVVSPNIGLHLRALGALGAQGWNMPMDPSWTTCSVSVSEDLRRLTVVMKRIKPSQEIPCRNRWFMKNTLDHWLIQARTLPDWDGIVVYLMAQMNRIYLGNPGWVFEDLYIVQLNLFFALYVYI